MSRRILYLASGLVAAFVAVAGAVPASAEHSLDHTGNQLGKCPEIPKLPNNPEQLIPNNPDQLLSPINDLADIIGCALAVVGG